MTQFEVGKTYSTRSICDHNCIIRVHVISRTAKTITAIEEGKQPKTFRPYVSEHYNAEVIRPWGSYSMSPIVSANDTKELRRDWEQAA